MKKTLCAMLVLLLAGLLPALAEALDIPPLATEGALEAIAPAEDESSPALELPADGPAEPEGSYEILPDLDGEALPDLDAPLDLDDAPLDLDDIPLDFDDILFESEVPNGATPAAAAPVLLVAPEEEACFIDGGRDSDALFAAYANGLLRGGGLRANATAYARDRLNDQETTIYDALKPLIARAADGSRASTEFDVPVSALLGMTRITGAQLTGAPLSNPMTEAERAAVEAAWRALFTYDLDSVANALWLDCTYELYWLDRYDVAIRALRPGLLSLYNADLGDQELYVADDACVTFRFPVLRQYQGDTYVLDAATIDRAKQARANAAAIVERYAGCPGWARLAGYVVEICALVRYDDQAATPAWQDANPQRQDPWKLISVFDGDSDTNVVCEGYAQALQYLCELDGGISSRMVTGYAPNGDHAWNLVRMDNGLNYLVDVTRMDGDWDSPGGLADWISENRGRLFLCGGTGSVSGGYEIRDRAGGNAGLRRYRADTLALYTDAALTLAPGRYNPTGFIELPGGAWYFDADGAYVTGKALLDGFGYRFADDGRLLGTLSGWHTVDGVRRFFEADGRLHTRHTPAADAAVPATCAGPGLTEGSHCALCGTVLEKQKPIPATGHRWGAVRYAWAGDLSAVTATRACLNDPGHVQSETALASARVAKAPTCTAKGVTAYTANFESPAFATQARRVRDIPATGHRWGAVRYAWAGDLSAVTATRACRNDPGHIQSETARVSARVARAPTCTAKGVTAYTAKFKNPAFRTQARRVRDIPAAGHTPVVDPAVPPTAAAEGLTEGSHCAVCGRVLTAQRRLPRLDTLLRLRGNACRKVRLGRTLQIVATNGIIRRCSSSDTAVATVSRRGRIVTRGPGVTTITVRLAGGKKLRLKLTVKAPSTPGPRTPGRSSVRPAYPSAQGR